MINFYSDTWVANEINADGSLTLYGYGDADSDGDTSHRLGIAVVNYDGSWNQIPVQGDSNRQAYVQATTSSDIPYPPVTSLWSAIWTSICGEITTRQFSRLGYGCC